MVETGEKTCGVRLGLHQSRDCLCGFLDLFASFFFAVLSGVKNAVIHVVFKESQCDGVQCGLHCRNLSEDINAVGVLCNHALQTPELAFDSA